MVATSLPEAEDGAPAEFKIPPALRLQIEYVPIASLKRPVRQLRRRNAKVIKKIAASITAFGFLLPVIVSEDLAIVVGSGRFEAALELGMTELPAIRLDHLTPEQLRLFRIAEGQLAMLSSWDADMIALELQELSDLELDLDLEITGFEGAELNAWLDFQIGSEVDPVADASPSRRTIAVTQIGDFWRCGDHCLIAGDAREPTVHDALMDGEQADMVFTDPPYNQPAANIGGLGKVVHGDFVMGSGELSQSEFKDLLTSALTQTARVSRDGSIHFVCMDWSHNQDLQAAGEVAYDKLKNLIVWTKTNAGMGTFYRSQHELIFVYKKGQAPHTNNFGLGDTGRYRTNVWEYPGVNTFRAGRDEELAMHPTCKPVALVADAIRDVSRRGQIVLDPFGGSGTTMIAAEKTKRRARLIELDPLYCDVICRRWEAFSGKPAVLAATGQTFADVAADRGAQPMEAGDE